MAGLSRQKQKLLIMKRLFEERTDENHAITGAKLIEYLNQYGIKAERKTIYDDIKILTDSGMEIETTKIGHSNAYYLSGRTFQDEELFILADAVASSKFLTQKKSKDLIKKIQSLTSDYKSKELRRSIYVNGRTKTFNEHIYYVINKIQDGIFNNFDIRFKYYEYNIDKQRQLKHGGETYTVSPYIMVWENENYYLVCYCSKHKKICRYRIDRMTQVTITETPRKELTDEEKAEVTNLQSVYHMYGGEFENVQIEFNNSLINAVIERFGDKIICHRNSENTFYINQEVQIAPAFWGWLFQFGNKARLLGPERVVQQAKSVLDEIKSCY